MIHDREWNRSCTPLPSNVYSILHYYHAVVLGLHMGLHTYFLVVGLGFVCLENDGLCVRDRSALSP